MEDRVKFCQWFLSQLWDFAKKVLWSDEKWFVLHQALNAKNNMMWASSDPHEEVEYKSQGHSKVMAWCGLIDGRMLEVRWMVDENGRPQSDLTAVTDFTTMCLAGSPKLN